MTDVSAAGEEDDEEDDDAAGCDNANAFNCDVVQSMHDIILLDVCVV